MAKINLAEVFACCSDVEDVMTSGWYIFSSVATLNTSGGRDNCAFLSLAPFIFNNRFAEHNITPTDHHDLTLSVSVSIMNATQLFSMRTPDGLSSVGVFLNNDGSLSIQTYDSSGTVTIRGTTVPALISPNVWRVVNLRTKAGTAGEIDLRVDGVSRLSLTGIPTGPTGQMYGKIRIGNNTSNYNTSIPNLSFTQILSRSPDTPGGPLTPLPRLLRTTMITPDGDAGPNDGVPSTAGPHHAMVSDASDASYVTVGAAAGQTEMYAMTSPPAELGAILGVAVTKRIKKTDSSTHITKARIRVGVATLDGDATAPPTVEQNTTDFFQDAPGSVGWINADIIGLDAGVVTQ